MSGSQPALPDPEFSRPHPVERLPGEGRVVKIEADADECRALARRFDLDSLDRLRAEVRLKPFAGGELVRVTGTLWAHVTQTCGITLAPVDSDLAGDFDLSFTFAPPEGPAGGEIDLDAEAADPPEPIENGRIDVGELVAEQLALLINPFPRAPGAEYAPPAEDDDTPTGPFAALAALRKSRS